MEKVSPKELEAYIYSTVIFPLQGLQSEGFMMNTPIKGMELMLCRTAVAEQDTEFRYQREMARGDVNYLVCSHNGRGNMYALAEYDPDRKSVVIFEREFKRIPKGGMVLAKMTDLFNSSYPFATVKLSSKPHTHTRAGQGGSDHYTIEEAT